MAIALYPRAKVARARGALAEAMAASNDRPRAALAFGDPEVDACLGGGLALAHWHEIGGEGLEGEAAAAPAAFAARLAAAILARAGPAAMATWIARRDDLHPPGLAQCGVPVERLILVKAPDEAGVLAAMEEAARAPGVAAVVGEAQGADLVTGRRLQLACERSGATAFLVRRRPFGGPAHGMATARAGAAASRWRIAAAPSEPLDGEPGLGAARWAVTLERCRGGQPGAWLMEQAIRETSDAALPLRVVARLGDRGLETAPPAHRVERRAG